jgi:hypothetical protein
MMLIEVKADLPNLFRFQRSFRVNRAPSVPELALGGCELGFMVGSDGFWFLSK